MEVGDGDVDVSGRSRAFQTWNAYLSSPLQRAFLPIDKRVMLSKPGETKNDGLISEASEVELDDLFAAMDLSNEFDELSDQSSFVGCSIDISCPQRVFELLDR